MTEQEAIAVVEQARSALGLPTAMALDGAEKAIVEYKKQPEQPGPCEDRIAWIVTYSSSLEEAEVQVDDLGGKILRVKRIP